MRRPRARSRACGRAVAAPPAPPRGRAGRASSCSSRCPPARSRMPQPPVAEPAPLGRRAAQPLADVRIARLGLTAHRLRIDPTSPQARRCEKPCSAISSARPPRSQARQFFPSRSFSAATSSIDSASSFFSRRFSSSSDLSRGHPTRPCRRTSPSTVEGLLADPVPPAHVRRRRSRLLLPQHADDLLLVEPALPHRPSPW